MTTESNNLICQNYPDKMFDNRVPIGAIVLFPGKIYDLIDGNLCLKAHLHLGGWMEAAGQELDKKLYSELYEVLGDVYRQQSVSDDTFQLPDMRGFFVRGAQNEAIKTPLGVFNDPDAVSGARLDYTTLKPTGSSIVEQVGTLQKHEFAEHSHQINDLTPIMGSDKGPAAQAISTPGGASKSTAVNGGNETRSNNIAMYYLIKTRESRLKL
ncbi:tail fiber protein [Desulfogranum japonicum]|uniref:tail fiber protein n=1 Tax=Desulfogranum japonicum TaxID=231447 RepID=UPI000490E24C|nr:tail fiber protein [Desulfogranum japonicum]